MKFKFKKAITILWVIANIFSLTALPVYADMTQVMLGNPVGLMDTVFGELGVNKSELQNTMKTINVSRQKIEPPTLSLTFDPTDPVSGEKVAVTATPTYFLNTTEKLYFTWYLKNKRCYDKAMDGASYKSKFADGDFEKCDLNGDSEVDIEDYKIKAARLLVNNDFVWQPESTVYASDKDNDGYRAVFGGDDQRNKNNEHCYLRNVSSGNDTEIACTHLFPNAHYYDEQGHVNNDVTGDGSFGSSEEKFWHTNPGNNDTAGTGNMDEANVAGLGENVFSFSYTTGDKVGVVIEGSSIQPTQEADSSYKTMWAFSKNTCNYDSDSAPLNIDNDNNDFPITTGPTTTIYNNTNGFTSGSNPTPITEAGYTTTVKTTTVQEIVTDPYTGQPQQVENNVNIRAKRTVETIITHIDPITGATITDSDTTAYNSTCPQATIETGGTLSEDGHSYTCTGADAINQPASTDLVTANLNDCLYANFLTPSEGGGSNQKLDVALKYFPENPINDPSPLPADYKTGDSKGDGDQVSFNATVSNPNNASYLNYTWEVYAGNESGSDDWGQALSRDKLDEATQTSGLGVDSFKFKFNFKPTYFSAGALPKYLKVKVTVKETLSDGSGEREGHTDITVPVSSSEERIRVYTAKVNAENVNFPAEKTDRAGLDAQERCLFTATEPAAICEVAKDEIIGIGIENGPEGNPTYTDFLWTIDGKTQACPDENFSLCLNDGSTNPNDKGKSTERTYFPILKEPGDSYTVGLSALNKQTGERIDLTRVFTVSTPEARIVPTEKDASNKYICRGLLLGSYLDFYGQPHEDRSDAKFQALPGNNIELFPVLHGTATPKTFDSASDCPYQWTVDGISINTTNATDYGYSIDLTDYGKLILPPKNVGEKYLISFSTIFTPTNAAKQMLNKYWNVTYNEFYERRLTHNIEIEMVDANTELAQKTNSPKKILATISSGIPSYIAFLFRIVLSGMAIILAIKIIFFVLPKTNNSDEF